MAGEIKIAYLIIAHRDPEHLKALVSELTKNADVFIHINKRSDIKPFIEAFASFQNIHRVQFINKRYRVRWGGFSILKATFELLENALATEDYDRIILLTGNDYPLKSSRELQKFFMENKDVNYLCSHVLNTDNHFALRYYDPYDIRLLHIFLKVVRMKFPNFILRKNPDYIEYKGMKYFPRGITAKWAVTGDCAKYILEFYKNNPGFNNIVKYMHAPDDFYVATVIYYSPFQASVCFDKNLFFNKRGLSIKDKKVLDISNHDMLMQSGALYAKNFLTGTSDTLIRELQRQWSNEINE